MKSTEKEMNYTTQLCMENLFIILVFLQQDVSWFNVSMDDSFLVQVQHSCGDLDREIQDGCHGERMVILHKLREIAIHQFHH